MNERSLTLNWGVLEKPLVFAFVFFLTVALAHVVQLTLRRWLDPRVQERNSKFIARVSESLIFATGLYVGIYHVLRLDLQALFTSLGVLTVVVAFSAQQIGQNFVAGVLIWIQRTIWYEDWVEIGTSGPCRVKDISLFRTVLRHRDGRLISLPNVQLVTLPIINYTRSGFVEIPVTFTIGGDPDPDLVTRVALEIADSHPTILPKVAEPERQQNERLFQLPQIRAWMSKEAGPTAFAPRVMVEEIIEGKIRFSARIWIREIRRSETVVSEFLAALQKRLQVKPEPHPDV